VARGRCYLVTGGTCSFPCELTNSFLIIKFRSPFLLQRQQQLLLLQRLDSRNYKGLGTWYLILRGYNFYCQTQILFHSP
jgi:hypothetical protein